MKTFYENPDMEIVRFEIEDVITTSVTNDGPNTDDGWSEIK